jgi:hypothetical protein
MFDGPIAIRYVALESAMPSSAHVSKPGKLSNAAAVVALIVLTGSPVAGAQVHKCLDKSGKVVEYAAECPPGTRAEETGIRNAPASPSSSQKSISDRDAEFRKRQLEQKEAAEKSEKKSAEVQARKEACESAQAYLKNLQAGHRIRKTDPKTGEPSFLADADYPKEIASAQKSVTANCK